MAWIQVQQRKTFGRPAGEVRVGVAEVRGSRLLNIILADTVMQRAGIALGGSLLLERGEGEHAGWVRVAIGKGDARMVGKLPNTTSGIVRFALPPEMPLEAVGSTGCDEFEVGPGWVAAKIPAAVTDARAPLAKAKAKQAAPAPRPAIPLVEPKPAAQEAKAHAAREHALSLLRSRVGTDQVVRATGLSPRDVVALAEQVRAERASAA
jgi:hypothetical protein